MYIYIYLYLYISLEKTQTINKCAAGLWPAKLSMCCVRLGALGASVSTSLPVAGMLMMLIVL